jgi:hypothetical protein
MPRIIIYAVSKDDGLVYSRVGKEVAYPVLQCYRIGRDGDFRGPFEYQLEKSSLGPFRNATIPGMLPKPWRSAHCTMSAICFPAVFFQHFWRVPRRA